MTLELLLLYQAAKCGIHAFLTLLWLWDKGLAGRRAFSKQLEQSGDTFLCDQESSVLDYVAKIERDVGGSCGHVNSLIGFGRVV